MATLLYTADNKVGINISSTLRAL